MKKNKQQRSRRLSWVEDEIVIAREQWPGQIGGCIEQWLRNLLVRTGLRVSRRELLLLDGSLYVSHAGLLSLARRKGCAGIQTRVVAELSRPEERAWVVEATVFKSAHSARGFVGLADADPSNVSPLLRGSELRLAETRAVNRALRKAYAIGICSAEEIGVSSHTERERSALPRLAVIPEVSSPELVSESAKLASGLSVQDRLKLILRDHQLDPRKVHAYGRRFLGLCEWNTATPEQLARLVSHLEQFAISNRTWLEAELSRAVQSEESELRGFDVSKEAA